MIDWKRSGFRGFKKDLLAGLFVGTIWGGTEYWTGLVFFRLHWSSALHILPSRLFLFVLSYAVVGALLQVLLGGIRSLLVHFREGVSGSVSGSPNRVFESTFFLACFSILILVHSNYLSHLSLLSTRFLPYAGAFAALSGLVYFGLNRLRRSAVRYRETTVFVGVVCFIGFIGLYQFLSIFHLLNGHGNLPAPESIRVQGSGSNVLLVTFDTLRPDHLGCYGNRTVKTRTIDRLARRGVLFENAVCQVPLTLPSHSSIMTSLYPVSHGVLTNANYRLQDEMVTIAEILQKNGYQTGAFVSSVVLDRGMGLDQGFECYDDEEMSVRFTLLDVLKGMKLKSPFLPLLRGSVFPRLMFQVDLSYRKAEYTTTRAISWLSSRPREPFFLWVHYYDPHIPLNPPQPYANMYSLTEEQRRTVQAKADSMVVRGPTGKALRALPDLSLYDGELTYADEQLGRLIRSLEELDFIDNTLIVFTSDHGEHLFDHNYFGHALLLYRPSVYVPLIFVREGVLPAGLRVEQLGRSVDITPTILDVLGLPIPDSMMGRSLAPVIEGTVPLDPVRYALVETFKPTVPLLSLISREWTFIMSADSLNKELYNNREDPDQSKNLYEEETAVAGTMEEDLLGMRRMYTVEGIEKRSRKVLDADMMEKLKALGYVQ